MRPDLEQYYLIDQYLGKKLEEKELHAFEDQMKADSSFAEQVYEQQALNDLILEAELNDVRLLVEKDLARLNNPSFFKAYWKWIGLGSLFMAGTLLYTFNKEENTVLVKNEKPANIEQKKESVTIESQPTASNNTTNHQSIKRETTTTDSKRSDIISVTSTTDRLQAPQQIELPAQTQAVVNTTVAATSPETKQETEIKKHDCNSVKIDFALKSQPACEEEQDGSISIEHITGGSAPLTIFLNGKKIRDRKITDMNSGIYEIKITDKNGCSSEQKVIIAEKSCVQPVQQQTLKFNINPVIGEVCKIPFNTKKQGDLTIYNRTGKIIYHITNHSDEYIEWNGTDGYGALVDQGLYVYIIEYSDGTKESGEVNIVR